MGERRQDPPEPSAQQPPEQLTLDLGIELPAGLCAYCQASVRRGAGVTIRRRYQFGVCVVTLHRTCREVIGKEGIAAIVAARERQWASLLGIARDQRQ